MFIVTLNNLHSKTVIIMKNYDNKIIIKINLAITYTDVSFTKRQSKQKVK